MKFALMKTVAIIATLGVSPVQAANLNIVTDIAPIGSLVSQVSGQDVTVLMAPGQSPHDASLRPSMARALQNADVVIWMGEGLIPGLEQPISQLAADAVILSLLQLETLPYLPPREEAIFENDDEDGHDDHHDHDADIDPHAWLSTSHAATWVEAMSALFIQSDPKNSAEYKANAERASNALSALTVELSRAAKPLNGTPMLALHDAFQYLEHELKLNVAGAVSGIDGSQASAKRLSTIKAAQNFACLLTDASEPRDGAQKMSDLLGVDPIALDILGANQPHGPNLYANMMRKIVSDLQNCRPS